jgi:hypothetical protein
MVLAGLAYPLVASSRLSVTIVRTSGATATAHDCPHHFRHSIIDDGVLTGKKPRKQEVFNSVCNCYSRAHGLQRLREAIQHRLLQNNYKICQFYYILIIQSMARRYEVS